jgi:arginyl-tRNA---protein transferase
MRYKGKLSGSYLLCPEVYTWHLLDDVLIAKLDASKYQRLNEDKAARDANMPIVGDIDSVLIFCDSQCMRYQIYKGVSCNPKLNSHCSIQLNSFESQLTTDDFEEVYEYARLVGRTCMQNMLLYRHV